MSAAETASIRWGDTELSYRVRRSARRRKTIEVTVDAPGVVTRAAPADTPPEHVEATVRRRAIHARLGRRSAFPRRG